ncbi:APC family permease [Candidatus Nitrososphaera sp. FF02]|uniref:APC family permease n=1 Tax=Candidatus Nitrososphaera sp. FF02 TaxID=3398226 RepID=UPI0039EC92EB
MYPKSAAEYVFAKNAFGNKMVAFVAGWMIVFVAVVSAAAVALGFSGYLVSFVPGIHPIVAAIVLIAVLSGVNFIGIRESAWTNTTFTIIEIAGLAVIIGGAFALGLPTQTDYYQMPSAVTSPSLALVAIFGAAGLVFFAYFGFENLANVAEETRNARRTIPIALIASIVITTAIYVLVALSAVALAGWEALSSSEAPLALAAQRVLGGTGSFVLSAIALFATTNTVLMMLVASSRIMFGMAQDGALPKALSSVHRSRKTPTLAVIATMALGAAIVAVSSGSIEAVASVAVFGIFAVYILVNLSLIRLRYSQPRLERPFRSPVSLRGFPVLAGLGAATSAAMLTQFDLVTVVAGAVTACLAVLAFIIKERLH